MSAKTAREARKQAQREQMSPEAVLNGITNDIDAVFSEVRKNHPQIASESPTDEELLILRDLIASTPTEGDPRLVNVAQQGLFVLLACLLTNGTPESVGKFFPHGEMEAMSALIGCATKEVIAITTQILANLPATEQAA